MPFDALQSAVLPERQSVGPPELGSERDAESGESVAGDGLLLESLAFNLEASLRVHARSQFFGWTQSLLQSLIPHEVLICARREGEPLALRADSFSTVAPDPAVFGELFLRDAGVAPALVKAWEERRFRPVMCEACNGGPIAGGAFARALERIGATQLLVHGTHDVEGRVTSLFTFASQPGTAGPRPAHLVQLVVPFLHAAWARAQVNGVARGDDKLVGASLLTVREQEILHWIQAGKSNFEIGAILAISPLTVKNHVQKILRKLNVVNRTQAIGKAIALRILSP